METKRCPRCGETKDKSLFPILNKNTGKTIYCHPCRKEYDREYWLRVKQKYNPIKNKHRGNIYIRNRLFIIGILKSKKCIDCGNNDWRVLEFDHIDRSLKSFNLADCKSQSIKKIEEEISKCDIVCANCHNIRTIEQRYYHKYVK